MRRNFVLTSVKWGVGVTSQKYCTHLCEGVTGLVVECAGGVGSGRYQPEVLHSPL